MVSKSWKNTGRLLTRRADSKMIERDVDNFTNARYKQNRLLLLGHDRMYIYSIAARSTVERRVIYVHHVSSSPVPRPGEGR